MSAKLNLKIIQGSTFTKTLRWESATKGYVLISNITKAAPVVIETAAHTIPVGWRVKITGVSGMKEINSVDDYRVVTDISSTSITINSINSTSYSTYTSGGVVEYNVPVPLAGYSARMQIRQKIGSEEKILELTSEDGNILIDTNDSTITIVIDAETTAGFTFNSAVYSLEMVASDDSVTQLVSGNISLIKEVTR